MREITVATVQMKPELGKTENNLVKMSDYISTISSQQKVDLIIFPELITSGYELGVQFTEIAQRVPGPAINLMAQRAADAGVYVAFGLATKEKVESIIYNSAVLIGPEGELLGHYNKVHLRGEERMAFREGYKLPVFDAGELGRIGLMIGYDLAFPEVARALALDGGELLCCLTNWEKQYVDEFKAYVRARAYENALFVAAANRVGEDVTMSFGGESMIVGPRGKVYAALETDAEARKERMKEQQELLRELESLRQSKAALEAAREAEIAREKARKEAEAAAKDGVAAPAPASTGTTTAAAGAPEAVAAVAPAAAAGTNGNGSSSSEGDPKKGDENPEMPKAATKAEAKEPTREKGTPARKLTERKPPEPAEGYCVARIDLDEVRRYREEFQTLQARQPTVYKAIVRRY